MEVHYERLALRMAKRQFKPIHKKFLAIGDNKLIYKITKYKIAQSSESSINVENDIIFNLPIEMEIYYFLRDLSISFNRCFQFHSLL